MFKVTMKVPEGHHWRLLLTSNIFQTLFCFSIVNFEQLIASQALRAIIL